jgi:hypothetical protein
MGLPRACAGRSGIGRKPQEDGCRGVELQQRHVGLGLFEGELLHALRLRFDGKAHGSLSAPGAMELLPHKARRFGRSRSKPRLHQGIELAQRCHPEGGVREWQLAVDLGLLDRNPDIERLNLLADRFRDLDDKRIGGPVPDGGADPVEDDLANGLRADDVPQFLPRRDALGEFEHLNQPGSGEAENPPFFREKSGDKTSIYVGPRLSDFADHVLWWDVEDGALVLIVDRRGARRHGEAGQIVDQRWQASGFAFDPGREIMLELEIHVRKALRDRSWQKMGVRSDGRQRAASGLAATVWHRKHW